jgi:hypothetical protein
MVGDMMADDPMTHIDQRHLDYIDNCYQDMVGDMPEGMMVVEDNVGYISWGMAADPLAACLHDILDSKDSWGNCYMDPYYNYKLVVKHNMLLPLPK